MTIHEEHLYFADNCKIFVIRNKRCKIQAYKHRFSKRKKRKAGFKTDLGGTVIGIHI